MRFFARATGRYPLAVNSGRLLYPAARPTASDLLPENPDTDYGFILGPRFGHVRFEGARPMARAVRTAERADNPAARTSPAPAGTGPQNSTPDEEGQTRCAPAGETTLF